jgi:hypothetical protein
MTPTVTQAGETVTIQFGDAVVVLSIEEAQAFARPFGEATIAAKDQRNARITREAREARTDAFWKEFPDSVPVSRFLRWGPTTGIGVYRVSKGVPIARVLWSDGSRSNESVCAIPSWPVPVQLRAECGRTAHTWRGGKAGVCGAPLDRAALPTAATKPCPKCAAIEAARGGAS